MGWWENSIPPGENGEKMKVVDEVPHCRAKDKRHTESSEFVSEPINEFNRSDVGDHK